MSKFDYIIEAMGRVYTNEGMYLSMINHISLDE